MTPSLVTWPTRMTVKPRRLARRMSCGAHLAHRAGRAVERVEIHGLDRIDDDDLRAVLAVERRRDVADAGRRRQLDRRARDGEALGTHAHLVDRLLARNIEAAQRLARFGAACGEGGDDLQQQGRFADAGIAADQQGRAGDEAAAADAVELGDAAGAARRHRAGAAQADDVDRARLAAAGCLAAEPFRYRLARRLLDQAVPRQAALAAPDPFGVHGAAFLADEASLRARHVRRSFSPLPLRERKGPIAKRWEGEGWGAAARLVLV
jgi:hypothetical protein